MNLFHNNFTLRVDVGVVGSEFVKARPGVLSLHCQILLVLIVDSVLVTVEHDDVTDEGGDGEQSQTSSQVQQSWYQTELACLPVNIDHKVNSIRFIQITLIFTEIF